MTAISLILCFLINHSDTTQTLFINPAQVQNYSGEIISLLSDHYQLQIDGSGRFPRIEEVLIQNDSIVAIINHNGVFHKDLLGEQESWIPVITKEYVVAGLVSITLILLFYYRF